MPRVGMVGGGQLARMTHQSAIALGQSLRVLSIGADESAALVVADLEIGSHLDLDALTRFARGCEVVTFDHEHVPTEHVRALVAAGHTVYPGADALQYAQDKALMRTRLAEAGLPVPPFRILEPGQGSGQAIAPTGLAAAVTDFGDSNGWPVVLKTARGGYDGRGVWVLNRGDLAAQLGAEPTGTLLLESFVPMRRELAAVVARSPFGQAAAWPVVETVQQNGICVQVIAPAPDLDADRAAAATRLALRIAGDLDVVGVLAVELFETEISAAAPDGLLINELAMRPHNSGHWSMDGALTSQFEQHLRAVLDYPLGRTDALAPFTVMANVLGGERAGTGTGEGSDQELGMDERLHHLAARFPQVKIHLYGKAFRPGRKLGHVNVLGSDLTELRRVAELAAGFLGNGFWDDGYSSDTGAAPPENASPAHRSVITEGGSS